MSVMKAVLKREPTCPPPLLLHADVMDIQTLDPFTHIYTFDRGFPPHTLQHMFEMFNKSTTAATLICYQQPKRCYELGLDETTTMIHRMAMKMSGSGEQHSCFVFVKAFALESGMGGSAVVVSVTTPCGKAAWQPLSATFSIPPIPTGSADFESPVRHGQTYFDAGGVTLATEAMRTTNTLSTERDSARTAYAAWIEDQLGLSSERRSQRRSRKTVQERNEERRAKLKHAR